MSEQDGVTDDKLIQPSVVAAESDKIPVPRSRRIARATGWALHVGASVTLVLLTLLPARTFANLLPALGVMFVVGLVLLCLLIGVILFLYGYHEFFQRPWGFILTVMIFFASLFAQSQASNSVVVTLAGVWGIVAALAVGPVLTVYLWHRDRSVRLLALMLLLLMWLLFTMGQMLGWADLLFAVVAGIPGQLLWPLQGVLCVTMWVCVVAPLAFLWHTLVMLKREQYGVGSAGDLHLSGVE